MNKRKPVIGIMANSNYMQTDDYFSDNYTYGNSYTKKIYELGGIPFLIPLTDDKIIKESLDMCDGLLLPGGKRVLPVSFKIIDYFYQQKKPILGICLGMQTLAMYSVKLDKKDKKIIKLIDNGNNHWPYKVDRSNYNILAHKALVKKDSYIYKILKKETIIINSFHNSNITEVGSKFKITIKSEDNIIEGIEYKDNDRFIIGIQFHPEVLSQYDIIIKEFIDKCKNNI